MSTVGSRFWYWSAGWIEETSKVKVTISDVISGRSRTAEVIISNPRNIKNSIYSPFQKTKIVDGLTNLIIFLGMVTNTSTSWDKDLGLILIVEVSDYMYELTNRYCLTNFATPSKRSDIIGQIVTLCTTSGEILLDIDASASNDLVTRDFSLSDKKASEAIEELAIEDIWYPQVSLDAAWRWDQTDAHYINDTEESKTPTGNPFAFLTTTDDFFYCGSTNIFTGLFFNMNISGDYILLFQQYWNGSDWSDLTTTETFQFNKYSGRVSWSTPPDWATLAFTSADPHTFTPNGTMICDGEDLWTAYPSIGTSTDNVVFSQGTASLQLTVKSGFSTGTLASFQISGTNIITTNQIQLSTISDQTLNSGSIQIGLKYGTAYAKTFVLPTFISGEAVSGATWSLNSTAINNIPQDFNNLTHVFLSAPISISGTNLVLHVDDIEAYGRAPDYVPRYWVRFGCNGVNNIGYLTQVMTLYRSGYDYRADDTPNFQYFKRGTKPIGGTTSGLTISLTDTITSQVKRMLSDYSFCDSPDELKTRVICRGQDVNGNKISATAVRDDIESTYHISSEFIDIVYGVTTQAYLNERAQALLQQFGQIVKRGKCGIIGLPIYQIGGTYYLARGGDIVRIKNVLQGVDQDYVIISSKYEEPPCVTSFELLDLSTYGRELPPWLPQQSLSASNIGDLIIAEESQNTLERTILFYISGTLIEGPNASAEIPMPFDFVCTGVNINVKTAPAGSDITIDVNMDGATIFTDQVNRPQIFAGLNDGYSLPDVTSFSKEQKLSVDIDTIGSGTAGSDLTVEVRGYTVI